MLDNGPPAQNIIIVIKLTDIFCFVVVGTSRFGVVMLLHRGGGLRFLLDDDTIECVFNDGTASSFNIFRFPAIEIKFAVTEINLKVYKYLPLEFSKSSSLKF